MLAANVEDPLAKEQLLAGIANPRSTGRQNKCSLSFNEALMQPLQAQANVATDDRQLENSSPVACGVSDNVSDDTAAALK